jgi:Glycosyltransferase Family 4
VRRVVLVAPEFPPSNTAGAHRPRLFAKHLPAFGWTPTVLTIRREAIEGPLDPMLDRLVDSSLAVVRTGALPVRPVRVIGDLGLRTLWPHASALAAAARRGEVDAIVLFGPPWFSFVLGPFMRRRWGTPFVVDYIDPWISDWTAAHRFPGKGWFYHRAAIALEPGVLRSASHVTAVSQGILSDLCARYPWLDPAQMTAMPYGAEPADIEASARLQVDPPDFRGGGDDLTMCFTGAIQPNGGAILRAVLGAIADLVRSDSPIGRRIRLRAYGTSNLSWGHDRFAVVPVARQLGVEARVSELPQRVPYLQAMAVLRSCDIVLVMGSADQYYHASKLYPAIVSGRPILAICHSASSIRTVMEQTGAGICVTFTEVSEITQRTAEIAAAIETLSTRGPRRPDAGAIERFTAHASTAALASILDRVAPVSEPAQVEAM